MMYGILLSLVCCVFNIYVAGCYFALKIQRTPIERRVRSRCRVPSVLVCAVIPNAHLFVAALVHVHHIVIAIN